MKTLCFLFLAFALIETVCRFAFLMIQEYPRTSTTTLRIDVIALIVNLGLVAWIALILWGGQ